MNGPEVLLAMDDCRDDALAAFRARPLAERRAAAERCGVRRPAPADVAPEVPPVVELVPALAPCWCPTCSRTDVRLYLSGPACPEHTPARLAGRPEPGACRYTLTPLHSTLDGARSAVEVNKARPGGYVSRQGAKAIAEGRRPRQTRRPR